MQGIGLCFYNRPSTDFERTDEGTAATGSQPAQLHCGLLGQHARSDRKVRLC